MEIVLAAGGMPFGPNTLACKSLGGSETAIIMVAKHLKDMGHLVTVFCLLPEQGQPDYWDNGLECEDGIRWVHLNNYQAYITNTQCDLLIASRDPRLVGLPTQAKKKVLYCHDIATHRGMQVAFDQINWCMDEVWCVSEFHRKQIADVTGYPKKFIKVIPNGIVPVEIIPAPRSETQLVYAARPERGLENLVKEGGVMERLSEFELKVAMYEHFPPDMEAFYKYIFARIAELPNVEIVGALPQAQMRQLIADSAAYIYPTQFEETSCIIARECMSVGTPFLTTKTGALPETLDGNGLFFEDWLEEKGEKEAEKGSEAWCQRFADYVRWALEDTTLITQIIKNMPVRHDLYWDNAATAMIKNSEPKPVSLYSRAWSLVQDGDVIPAYALLTDAGELDVMCLRLAREIEEFYPFIRDEDDDGYESLASYYKRFYDFKEPEIMYGIDYARGTTRYNTIKNTIATTTKPGDLIYEYGCGEGHIIGPLAKDFQDRNFVAFDQVQSNVDLVNKFQADFGTTNLEAHCVDTPEAAAKKVHGVPAEAVICVEVLEHCVKPWDVIEGVEAMCKEGGQVVITTPYGAWEPLNFEIKFREFPWRNHIWHLDKSAARIMFGKKPAMEMISLSSGSTHEGRSIGNLFYTYEADHAPVGRLDPLKKAKEAWSRQSVAVACICMNDEDTILHMLHSLDREVQFVQFAMGPSTDRTRDLIKMFFSNHPHMHYRIIDVPKITPSLEIAGERTKGFGFDHARNESMFELDSIFDWVLWMDTDEYLSGNLGKYLRANMLDGYLIPQHHFTTHPRGAPTQIDRPARLFRTGRGYRAVGHVHEHFEIKGGGPGRCFMPQDVDLGHTGYVNEGVRKARFERNFPFLCWDHEDNPDRKLGKFLWFRDIVHRMRWAGANEQMKDSVELAKEADTYYNANWRDMATFGQGTFQAIEYLAEARSILGIGTEVQFGLKLDDRDCTIKGRFINTGEMTRIIKQILDPEFKRRGSKYY